MYYIDMVSTKKYKRKANDIKRSSGEIVKSILIGLAAGAVITAELLDHFFSAYNRSYKTAHRSLYGGGYGYDKNETKFSYEDPELQKFFSVLNRLKRQGFIEKKESKQGSLWNITKSGLEKLGFYKRKKDTKYDAVKDNKVKIVVFDIPECERWKRAWLREALTVLEFSMLQKSVWMGKNKIPEQFLEDLRDMRLLNRTHILEVSASGTFKEIV